jgi:hypothetical protein
VLNFIIVQVYEHTLQVVKGAAGEFSREVTGDVACDSTQLCFRSSLAFRGEVVTFGAILYGDIRIHTTPQQNINNLRFPISNLNNRPTLNIDKSLKTLTLSQDPSSLEHGTDGAHM